ncbi:MAG: flippase [Parcubacteria group bacterium]
MSRVRAVLKNTLYQGITRMLGVTTGIIAFALLTRYLGPAGFGDYSIALTYVGAVAAIADLGLPVLFLRTISLHRPSNKTTIANLNTLRLLATAIVFTCGITIALFLPYGANVTLGIAITSIGFIGVNFTQYLGSIFQERLKTHESGIADSLGRFVILVLSFWGIYHEASLSWFFWSFVIGCAISFLLTYLLSLRHMPSSLAFHPQAWRPLLHQAVPLMLVSLFSLVYFKVDTLFLSLMDSSYVVGVYSAAYKYIDVFVTVPAIFGALALPFFTRSSAYRDERRFSLQLERSLRLILIAGGLLAGITLVEADRFILLFSGQAYQESIPILRILSFSILPLFLGSLCTTALIARNRSTVVARLFGITAFVSLILYVVTIREFSLYGAALSTVLIELSIAIATLFAISRDATLRVRWHIVPGYLASLAGFVVCLFAAHTLPLVFTLLIGVAVYALLLVLLRVVYVEEISHVLIGTRLPER